MDGQRRILDLFFHLIDKRKLQKKDLMEKYHVSSSTIQRDMGIIEEILEDHLEKEGIPLDDFDIISRKEKGSYYIQTAEILALRQALTDNEIMAIVKILLASRAFSKMEMEKICHLLIHQTSKEQLLKKYIANELFYYAPVPKENLFEKIDLIAKAMEQDQVISFHYEGYKQEATLKRLPTSIYFSDLYFYMMTEDMAAEDVGIITQSQKFHIDKMSKIQILEERKKIDYKKRFEGGKVRRQTDWMFLGNEIQLTIEYYWNPEYVYDRFPDYEILKEEEGVTTIRLKVNDGYGTKMWLLSQGQMLKVISPKSIQDYLVSQMKNSLSYYEN